MTLLLRRLRRDRRGAAVLEFAFVAPVMILLIMGLMDFGFRIYLQSILTGAVQRAGRDSSLENSTTRAADIDAAVVNSVRGVLNTVTWASTRKSFTDYGSIRPERFDDTNGNGQYDPGECYSDVNDNNQWDADAGKTGQGGANDTVVYTMTITYPRMFPLGLWLGGPDDETITSSTVLKNQPYSVQNTVAPVTRC